MTTKNLWISFSIFVYVVCFPLVKTFTQEPLIIDHNNTILGQIPINWIDSAMAKHHIAYGHTSHGSQISSGMQSLEHYFTDGRFEFSSEMQAGSLHFVEGAGYGNGYLELDCGYSGWESETREYLNDHPDCNVIMWSWCGQVNNVDLVSHYLDPMEQLRADYPDVHFVFMTGHLEGLGPEGSLFQANQMIRDHCIEHNAILFDFADIEKYDPDKEINYQFYYADDGCNYIDSNGMAMNWANEWMERNPEDELSLIAEKCQSCAHSQPLNCVQKGIAAWHLWTRLAGWNGQVVGLDHCSKRANLSIYPNPARLWLTIDFADNMERIVISDLMGCAVYYDSVVEENTITLQINSWPVGTYLVRIFDKSEMITAAFFMIK